MNMNDVTKELLTKAGADASLLPGFENLNLDDLMNKGYISREYRPVGDNWSPETYGIDWSKMMTDPNMSQYFDNRNRFLGSTWNINPATGDLLMTDVDPVHGGQDVRPEVKFNFASGEATPEIYSQKQREAEERAATFAPLSVAMPMFTGAGGLFSNLLGAGGLSGAVASSLNIPQWAASGLTNAGLSGIMSGGDTKTMLASGLTGTAGSIFSPEVVQTLQDAGLDKATATAINQGGLSAVSQLLKGKGVSDAALSGLFSGSESLADLPRGTLAMLANVLKGNSNG